MFIACRRCGVEPVEKPARYCYTCKKRTQYSSIQRGVFLIQKKVLEHWNDEMDERRRAIKYGIDKEGINVQYPSTLWRLIVHLRGCFQISYRDIVKFLNKQLGAVMPSIPNYSTISKKLASGKLPDIPTSVDYFRSDILIELTPYETSISEYNTHLIEKMRFDPSWLCLEFEVETRGSQTRLRD